MKRILSLVLIIMFVLLPFAKAFAFFDVDDSYSWAYDAIDELNKKEIIKGYPDGSFKPQNNITNAETAKITVLVYGESNDVTYNDVSEDKWYFNYVKKSKDYFLRDVRDKNFRPENNTLRKEIAYALYIGAGFFKEDKNYKEELVINEKYACAVSYLNKIGILKGYPDGTMGEEKEVTRAEFAVLIKRINDIKNVSQSDDTTATLPYPRPHTYFYIVTDVMTVLSEDGEAIQKICGYVNGEYEENFIPDDLEIRNIVSQKVQIDKNDIIYILKDYFGKIMSVIVLQDADYLKDTGLPLSFNGTAPKHKYVSGKVERIINGNVIEILEKSFWVENQGYVEQIEAYRIKEDATFYLFENDEMKLSNLSKIKEDYVRGKGDLIYTHIYDDEITDVLIVR